MNKPGRNDPCPCGSGKKYKKCCLLKHEAALPRRASAGASNHFTAELRPELDDAVDALLARLEAGEGRRVGKEIAALLEKHPDYHMTNYAMGVYRGMVEDDARGSMPFFERAVQIFPPFPEAHLNLAGVARTLCEIPKAVAAYRLAERYSDGEGVIAEQARKELQFMEGILAATTPFQTVDEYVANHDLYVEAFRCLQDQEFQQAVDRFQQVLK